jgi:23S rRNA-/tRNA-specific pseudouridylate synthase
VKLLFDEERVLREGAPIRARDAVAVGTTIEVRIPPERVLAPLEPEAIDVPILYQDDRSSSSTSPPIWSCTLHAATRRAPS